MIHLKSLPRLWKISARLHTQEQMQNKCVHNYLFAQRTAFYACLFSHYILVTYAPDKQQLFGLRGKPEDPQLEPHAGIKTHLILAITNCSLKYIYCVTFYMHLA